MIYQPIAEGQLQPSLITFGCWPLGGEYWGETDIPAMQRAIKAALDVGINCFDTAPLYGNGLADLRLKEALGSHRHSVIIATKVGARLINGHAQSDLSAQFIRQDVEASLQRLDLDSIPLLQVHWPCEQGTSIQESFEALAQLRTEGKIQHIGICNYQASDIQEILKITPIVSLQTPFSMIRREFEGELQDFCRASQLPVFAYEGLCRGLLSGKYKRPPRFPGTDMRSSDPRFQKHWFWHTRNILDSLEQLSVKTKIPICGLSLGWLCAQKTISSVVVGMKTEEQLFQNISALRVVNRAKLITVLTKLINIHGGYPSAT